MWTALGRELGWRAAPCRESKPGISPPRLQHQPAMLLPPYSPQLGTLSGWEFTFFFVGRGGGGRWSTAQSLFRKKKREPLLLRQKSSASDGAQSTRSPQTPLPSQALPWRLTSGSLQSLSSLLVPPGCPRSQQTLPFPSQPSLRTPDSPRVGAPACLPSSVGAKPQDEGGGPPRLPRADFSLWTLRPLASGRSSEQPRET